LSAAALQSSRDDHISSRWFNQLSRYIYDAVGIKMPPTKRTMLEGRLRRRLRETGIGTFDEYCSYLFDHDGLKTEAIHLIDCVTTNKTDFFREPNHFDYLRDVALPEIAGRGVRRIRMWSSACSTGAEPYTMAMVLQEFVDRQRGLDYSVLATDISTDVLGAAHRGVYTRDMVEPVPPELRQKYVRTSATPGAREVRIVPGLRSRVGFGRMNLMDRKYRVGEPMDAIFCRNVLIYFDQPTQAAVLQRLCECLKPGGYLFIGHSESLAGAGLPVKPVAHTVFRKS
jgi:chemotaxis protein methyltransferase CheR